MTRLRADVLAAWRAGLAAADASAAVREALSLPQLSSWRDPDLVIATGKAAAAMLRGVGPEARGFALVPRDADALDIPPAVTVLRADHPIPTQEGLRAGDRLLASIRATRPAARILYLVSGGTSALFESPREGISAASLIEMHRLLWGCGLPIAEMNLVRRALSRSKGGGLLEAAPQSETLTLAVSDVPGDDPATIGSGPSVAARPTNDEARRLLEAAGLWAQAPADVREVLERTNRPPLPRGRSAGYRVVCSNRQSVLAARSELASAGYELVAAPLPALAGDVSAVAESVARALVAVLDSGGRRGFVLGGETTLALSASPGRGGRNQHLAATVALRLAGRHGFALIAAGTDGVDGNSDAAGAIVDGSSAERAQRAGHDLAGALSSFDTATALSACGDAVTTGPTGTNVGDVLVAVAAPG